MNSAKLHGRASVTLHSQREQTSRCSHRSNPSPKPPLQARRTDNHHPDCLLSPSAISTHPYARYAPSNPSVRDFFCTPTRTRVDLRIHRFQSVCSRVSVSRNETSGVAQSAFDASSEPPRSIRESGSAHSLSTESIRAQFVS
jgi:hypothetical protein